MQVAGWRSKFLSLLDLDGFQLKIICLSPWHILEWPALGPYSAKLHLTGSFQKGWPILFTPSDHMYQEEQCFLGVVTKKDISEIPEIYQEVWVTRSQSS